MPADLHIHSTFSDGTDTPEEIVKKAAVGGLTVISITDHDNIDAIKPAIKAAQDLSIEVIPGIELSTELPGYEIHILGFYFDYESEFLNNFLKKLVLSRRERIYKIADKLSNIGVKVDAEKILKSAGQGSAGRPHIARVMVEDGFASDIGDAFRKYLNFGLPSYVSHYKMTPKEAVDLIKKCGGFSVLAHPAASKCRHILDNFISDGIDGIEVFYLNHNNFQKKEFLDFAIKNGLIITGGSDYHGVSINKNVNLGDLKLNDKYIIDLKNRRNLKP